MENDTMEVQQPGMEDKETDPGTEQMSFTDKLVCEANLSLVMSLF